MASDRRTLILYGAAACAVALIGARYLLDAQSQDAGGASQSAAAHTSSGGGGSSGALEHRGPGTVTVHVAGLVKHPGVYRLLPSARTEDAIQAAGGATRRGDPNALNLAARLEDGRQLIVPARAAAATAASAAPATVPGATASPTAPAVPAAPININTATPEQLDQLDGIGPGLAAKIVAERTKRGGFASLHDLDAVPGIGAKRLESLKPEVTF